jgi:hypothetical protein
MTVDNTTPREQSAITATLKTADGVALSGWEIKLEIVDAAENQLYTGYLDSNEQVVYKTTDANGNVTAIYYGPLAAELPTLTTPGDEMTVYIQATITLDGITILSVKAPIVIYI